MRKALWAAAAATALISTAAWATVTFNTETGEGFVGKGDVQTALGWNNAQLQAGAGSLIFTFDDTETYSAVCEWITGEGTRGQKTHDITLKRHRIVSDTVQYSSRKNSQNDVTGFNLTGFAGEGTTSGQAPAVGAACVGNEDGIDHNGTWVSVDLVSSTGGVLSVNGVALTITYLLP